MLLQTNSYIVPKDKRAEHARLLRRFRASLAKLGCDSFEVYEQVGSNWTTGEPTGRYVQIMRFRDRRHQLAVQAAERSDPVSQAIIAEFCQLINFPYQQQQGLFAVGFYNGVLPVAPTRPQAGEPAGAAAAHEPASAAPESTGTDPHGADDVEMRQELDSDDPEAAAGDEGDGEDIESSFGDLDPHEEPSDVEPDDRDMTVDPGSDAAEATPEELEPVEVVAQHDGADHAEVAAPDMTSERRHEEGANGAAPVNDPAPDAGVDELGALLDAHMQSEDAVQSPDAHPLAGSQNGPDEAHDGLDALDLDALDMPDEPSSPSQHASKHAAR